MFELKGGSYPLTTIQLLSTELDKFSQQLHNKIQQAPVFFQNAPIVVDLTAVEDSKQLNITKLKTIMLEHKLILVAIKGGNPQQRSDALAQHIATLVAGRTKNTNDSTGNSEPEPKTEPKIKKSPINYKLITEPVRSGQQIYAPQGDLIVISSVSNGSELLASGNIHVYGALRGRALAGINGDLNARIFCQSLEAELISIAGRYKLSEDLEGGWSQACEAKLDGENLIVRAMGEKS